MKKIIGPIDPSIEARADKLTNAYSELNRQANRRWSACAVVSLVAFNLEKSTDSQVIFATTLNGDNIFPIILIILAMTNFVYCVAHISAYKASDMLLAFNRDFGLNKVPITRYDVDRKFNYGDLIHRPRRGKAIEDKLIYLRVE